MRRVLAAALLLIAGVPAAATDRPNVLLILADDMGFSDAGCYGGEIATPEPRPARRQRPAVHPVL